MQATMQETEVQVKHPTPALICAAPDLLASCKELYGILLDGMEADYDAITTALGRARQAIAKAGA